MDEGTIKAVCNFKCMSTGMLRTFAFNARRKGLMTISDGDIEHWVDPNGVHVVHCHFLHDHRKLDYYVRAVVLLKFKDSDGPVHRVLEFLIEDFNNLPTVDMFRATYKVACEAEVEAETKS